MPEAVAAHLFAPIKTKRDDIGLFTQIVCDMSDDYEAAAYKLGAAGKLGFSSGMAAHMMWIKVAGEIALSWIQSRKRPMPCR